MARLINKITPPPHFQKSQYIRILTRGYSLIELLTVVGILTALSAVALVQYGKYKRNAGAEVASAQRQFESENCIGVSNRKQCLCEKGLGEVLGLDSEDCCPLGQEKDSNGNCVARVAQAGSPSSPSPTTNPPQTAQACPSGQTRNSDGNCVNDSCTSSWQTRNSDGTCVDKECDPDDYVHPFMFQNPDTNEVYSTIKTPKCLCPEGYVWLQPNNVPAIDPNRDDFPNGIGSGGGFICAIHSDSFSVWDPSSQSGNLSLPSIFGTVYTGPSPW